MLLGHAHTFFFTYSNWKLNWKACLRDILWDLPWHSSCSWDIPELYGDADANRAMVY